MILSSPVTAWPGEIEIHDTMTLPMAAAWEDALNAARGKRSFASLHLALLPGILACVKAWRLEGFPSAPTVDTFPVKPHQARAELIDALVKVIGEMYADEVTVPNE